MNFETFRNQTIDTFEFVFDGSLYYVFRITGIKTMQVIGYDIMV